MFTSGRSLGYAPRLLYPAKSVVTHGRALAWVLGRRRPAPGTRILFYHRVADSDDELAVSPRRFAQQMEELARQGLRGAHTEDALAGEGTIGLNFDDGYRDIAENALPVLERLGFSATVFVPTGVVDGRARFEWYDEQPPLLGWDEIRDLDAAGTLRFEPHTVTHRNLLTLDGETVADEIRASKEELEQRIGRTTSIFCYPAGLFGERERALASGAGFRYAVSCEPGVNDETTDPLALRRIQVDHRDRLLAFRAKVAGGLDTPPPLRARWRWLRYGTSNRS